MNGSIRYNMSILAVGLMVLVLWAVLLFCGRYTCELILAVRMPNEARYVSMRPSGLLPADFDSVSNSHQPSVAWGSIQTDTPFGTLGIADYIESRLPGGRRSDVLSYEKASDTWVYFDRATGQIVYRRLFRRDVDEDEALPHRVTESYAGPDGISRVPGAELGRFFALLTAPESVRPLIVYDRVLRRFFAIDWTNQTVRAGPELEASCHPVRFGVPGASADRLGTVGVSWDPSRKKVVREDQTDPGKERTDWTYDMPFLVDNAGPSLAVVDAGGRVDLLDRQTLELVEGRGRLPAPETLYGQGSAEPRQMLSYAATPVFTGEEHKYAGLVVASTSRQGMSLALAVFDDAGRQIGTVNSRVLPFQQQQGPNARTGYVKSATAALTEVPWGPTLGAGKYILESLHPPVLTLISFFTADRIEARASHRTLFLMPNSFVAMQWDRAGQGWLDILLTALWLMVPAVLLAAFLTWRVARDAAVVGLSANARALWVLGTLAFSLPAYITYRLTRPSLRLVTCANCGQARRPDGEKCHHCGSAWNVPELIPPAWRVLDDEQEREDPAPAKKANSHAP
jgi:hypothetical protein